MFRLLKWFFYLVIIFIIVVLYWFLPKYSYIQKNPGYCVNLTGNFYYCGNDAGLDNLFKN
jgi:hypothetical protein